MYCLTNFRSNVSIRYGCGLSEESLNLDRVGGKSVQDGGSIPPASTK